MINLSLNKISLFWAVILLVVNVMRLVSTARLRLKITENLFEDDQGGLRQLPLNVANAVMIFTDDNLLDMNSADQWTSTIPKGNGWAILGPQKTAYSVSMYHQLHCLNSMRYDLTLSKAGKGASQVELNHAHHCYNYLRQALLCKADVTLEPTEQVILLNGQIGAAASGSGVAHICKNWVQIREYMERNFRANADYEFWNTRV